MSEQSTAANQGPLNVEALRTQELGTVHEAQAYLGDVVASAQKSATPEMGRQETEIPGVTFVNQNYYPPSRDYQHNEVRIENPDGTSATASELNGVTFLSFTELIDGEIKTVKRSQSGPHPDFDFRDTSHAEKDASSAEDFIAQAQEFKSRLESRYDNPEEFSRKTRIKHKVSRLAGRLALK